MLKDLELNYIEKWLPEASVKYKDGSPVWSRTGFTVAYLMADRESAATDSPAMPQAMVR